MMGAMIVVVFAVSLPVIYLIGVHLWLGEEARIAGLTGPTHVTPQREVKKEERSSGAGSMRPSMAHG